MLAGHIDEIGVIVTWIDDDGFVWIGPVQPLYMHSPSEMVSLEDVERAASLLVEACRTVTPETDLTAR